MIILIVIRLFSTFGEKGMFTRVSLGKYLPTKSKTSENTGLNFF